MAASEYGTKHPRSRRSGSRARAPTTHNSSSPIEPNPRSENLQGAVLHVLAAIDSRIRHIERLVMEERTANGRMLSPKAVAERMDVSVGTVRDEIKRAVREGESVLFGQFRFIQTGAGAKRPRYRIWEPDMVGSHHA